MKIIYCDDNLIVINKPPGMSVHGGFSVAGETLVDELLKQFPEIRGVGDDPALARKGGDDSALRPGIVHRLDKDTSGVMVVARNQETFEALKKLFKTRSVVKTYRAIVCGAPKQKTGVITIPIGRLVKNPLKRGIAQGRSKIRGEREAQTAYRVLKAGSGYALVELLPKTGRMHQLRVHLKAIGNPVACDRFYGGKNVCCPPGCGRQLLHASSLSFTLLDKAFHFEADDPEDFEHAIRFITPPPLTDEVSVLSRKNRNSK